jgi:hypothetical protein
VCLAVNTPCRHLRGMRCPELAKSCRYICVQNSLHFSSYYCHRSVTSRSLVPKHPLFRKPSACLQGGRAAVHPKEEGSMFLSERLVPIKQTRSHIYRQYERADVTCNGVSTVKTGPCRSWAVHITLGTFVPSPSEYFSPFSLSLALNSTYGR